MNQTKLKFIHKLNIEITFKLLFNTLKFYQFLSKFA